jgi:hypothetical protein
MKMSDLPYYTLPDPPKQMNATGLLIRFIDTFGFRYRWATEGLTENDLHFQACDTSMNLEEILTHIHGLISATDAFITGKKREDIKDETFEDRRRKTLVKTVRIKEELSKLDDHYLENRRYNVPWDSGEYPLWYLINGPLSDAFTHVGQVASWRRINGNPIPNANAFYGTPAKKGD